MGPSRTGLPVDDLRELERLPTLAVGTQHVVAVVAQPAIAPLLVGAAVAIEVCLGDLGVRLGVTAGDALEDSGEALALLLALALALHLDTPEAAAGRGAPRRLEDGDAA